MKLRLFPGRTDADLVRGTLAGKPQLLEELIARYQKRACAVAHAAGVPPDVVPDVVQESFLRCLGALPGLRAPEAFGPWFLAIVRNAARRELRDGRRLRQVPHQEKETESYADAFERGELNAYLWSCVRDLPAGVREAVFLFYYEGESVREVARVLGTTVPAVKNRLQKGRDLLRERLWREIGGVLRDMLPSAREWRQGARRLTLIALATLPAAWSGSAAAAAAPGAGSGAFLGPSLAGSLLLMSTKKVAVAAVACCVLFSFGFLGGFAGIGASRPAAPAAGEAPPPRALARELQPASKPEQADAPAAGASAGGSDAVEAVPSPEHGALRVRAVWDATDEPAEGILVRLEPGLGTPRPLLARHEGVTDREGAVLLEGLPAGKMLVGVDRMWLVRGSRQATVIAGETLDVLLRLPEGINVEGIVVHANDAPAAGAEVWLSDGPFNRLSANLVARAGVDGTFRLRGVEQGWYVGARAAGWAPSSLKAVNAERGGTFSLRLVLPGAGGGLRGQVRDALGGPVGGAIVVVGSREPVATYSASAALARAVTGGDGRFELQGLPPGEAPVAVRAAGLGPVELEVAIEAQRTAAVDITLPPGVTLHGTVTDRDGQPVREARVQVGEGDDRAFAGGDLVLSETRTGERGAYRLEGLPPGKLALAVLAEGHGRLRQSVEAAAGAEVELNLVLQGSLRIAGRVLLEDGTPLRRAEVMGIGLSHALTDESGRFTFEDCEDREHVIEVHERGHAFPCARLEGIRPQAEEMRVIVPAASRSTAFISGTVVDPDGSRVRGARIECVRQEASFAAPRARSGWFGGFRLGPMPAGTYALRVEAEGHPSAWTEKIAVEAGATADAGTIRLARAGFLRVAFTTAAGATGDGLYYGVFDEQGRCLLAETLSSEPGRRDPLVPGSHRVVVRGKGLEISRAVAIREGEETLLEISLGEERQ